MPASPSCSATTSSSRSARSSSASTCPAMCRPTGRCEAGACLIRRSTNLSVVPAKRSASRDPYAEDSRFRSVADALCYQQMPVIMGPGVRRDDASFRPLSSRRLQRSLQILDQIVAVLEAGGEPDETLADAEFGADFRRQPLMGGGRRMSDEALGVAEI